MFEFVSGLLVRALFVVGIAIAIVFYALYVHAGISVEGLGLFLHTLGF